MIAIAARRTAPVSTLEHGSSRRFWSNVIALMSTGEVVAVYIGLEPEGPMKQVASVSAVAGKGLEGDRYFQDVPPEERDPTVEVTLIETEGIDAARAESGIDILPEDSRRNLHTRGVRLDDLLGKHFLVGEVELEGLEPNPPCAHLQRLAGKELLKPMIERGGIRARILVGGPISEGDAVRGV
jgi:MOSC domain-containing protein YiiM